LRKARYILIFTTLLLWDISAKAQTVFDKYVDFNDAIVNHHPDTAMALGVSILNSGEKLPPKTQTKFYNFMAKLYEDKTQVDDAIKYYELVVAAEPDYYIAHRALGYLYLKKSETVVLSDEMSTLPSHGDWRKLAALHLEKDEACNPDKEELDLIKVLYRSLNDKTGLKTLDNRLKQLAGKCVDLLTD
jgi:tetratricopeptide (TPR) repeat protein